MIYLDYAATTPVSEAVRRCVIDGLRSRHLQRETLALQVAKAQMARVLGSPVSDMLYWTAGGSAANNLAIEYLLEPSRPVLERRRIVISSVEHPSVYNAVQRYVEAGYEIFLLPVDPTGCVVPDAADEMITPQTALVSVMLYNNELGTRQPVEAIGALCHEKGVPFHVDAIQGLGAERMDFESWKASAVTLSGHKVYGPKGIGALWMRRTVIEEAFSEALSCAEYSTSLVLAQGFALAVEQAYEALDIQNLQRRRLKNMLAAGLRAMDLNIMRVGADPEDAARSHPGILNVCFPGMDADSMLIRYALEGIAVSAGSACSSGAVSASRALMATGLSEPQARRCVRFSIGVPTTALEIERTLEVTKRILETV